MSLEHIRKHILDAEQELIHRSHFFHCTQVIANINNLLISMQKLYSIYESVKYSWRFVYIKKLKEL